MGSLLVSSGRVISQSVNKTGAGILKDKRYDKTRNGYQVGLHSELLSIIRAPEASIRGATIFIAGYTKGDNYCTSRPCHRCFSLLKERGVKRVIFHDNFGNIFALEM